MKKLIGALAASGTLMVSGSALAAEPATANSIQLGLGFRYGIEMNEGDFNPWGVGLGVDGGYTLPALPIYVGGTFEYFFGDSQGDDDAGMKGNAWHLMAEGGYDIGLGDSFVLRPKLGAGLGTLRTELCAAGNCASDSQTNLALAPGVKAILLLPKVRLSVDARYALIFADETGKALILSAGIGF
jgi:hypothetical protein